MNPKNARWMLPGMAALLLALVGGCPTDIGSILDEVDLQDIELNIGQSVDAIQGQDPRDLADFPAGFYDRGDTIILDDNVDVIADVSQDLVIEELPDITLLGFENLTGYDIYITYAVDGDEQGVLVYDGETLLLEYGCLTFVELFTEEDFDTLTGIFVDDFDLSGADFLSPVDFDCGEALIITIEADALSATAERIDLVN